jgi:hypothetical protein
MIRSSGSNISKKNSDLSIHSSILSPHLSLGIMMIERTKTKTDPLPPQKAAGDDTEKSVIIGPTPTNLLFFSVLTPVTSKDQRISDLERRLEFLEGVRGRVGVYGTKPDTKSVVMTTPKKDNDEEDTLDE